VGVGYARGRCDIGKRAVAVVAKQNIGTPAVR
jgi:hypothetical protein